MQYWDAMTDKSGFDDGAAVPDHAQATRAVYLKAINRLAEKHGSTVRVMAYNRPGMHNWCLIVFVPLAVYKTFKPEQVLGFADTRGRGDMMDADPAMERAIEDARAAALDQYVEVTITVLPTFEQWLKEVSNA